MEFIFLACDGIFDCKTSQQVVNFLHQEIYKKDFAAQRGSQCNLQNGLERLFNKCLAPKANNKDGIGTDNMSAILIELAKSDRYPQTTTVEKDAELQRRRTYSKDYGTLDMRIEKWMDVYVDKLEMVRRGDLVYGSISIVWLVGMCLLFAHYQKAWFEYFVAR